MEAGNADSWGDKCDILTQIDIQTSVTNLYTVAFQIPGYVFTEWAPFTFRAPTNYGRTDFVKLPLTEELCLLSINTSDKQNKYYPGKGTIDNGCLVKSLTAGPAHLYGTGGGSPNDGP